MKRALRIGLVVISTFTVAGAQGTPTAPGSQPSPAEDAEPAKPPEPKPVPDPNKPVEPPVETPVEAPPPLVSPPPARPLPLPVPLRPIEPSPDDDLSSARLSPRTHFDLGWQLLGLPQKLLDLVFLPIGLGVSAVDEYALDTRLFEFLEFFHGWISVSPRVKFSFSGSLGLGVWVESAKLAGERAALRVGGLVRTNADFQVAIEYRHVLLLPDGRGLRARAYIDHDKNRRYYGIGGDSAVADQRVIRANSSGATVDVDIQGVDRYTYSGVAGLGFIRQRFTPGIDTTIPALSTNDTIPLPPGFDATALYVTGSLSGRYDTRDSNGRPVRGAYAEISAVAREEITGKELSAITASTTITKLLPLIAEHRTILLTLGGAAAIPLGAGDTIPLDALPEISRLNNRGYDSDRFRDRYALVGSVEYRFPVYDYLASRAGLDAFVFVDTGTLWGTNKFTDSRIRYSVGTGLRAASQNDLMFSMTLAGSPDGIQFALGVEGQ